MRSERRPVDSRLRHIFWPAAFPDAPQARVPAHALAVLVAVTSVCTSFSLFYWADDPQVVHGVGVAAVCLVAALAAGSLVAWADRRLRAAGASAADIDRPGGGRAARWRSG